MRYGGVEQPHAAGPPPQPRGGAELEPVYVDSLLRKRDVEAASPPPLRL